MSDNLSPRSPYRSPGSDPREFRSRSANTKAALLLLGGIVLAIVAVALFA